MKTNFFIKTSFFLASLLALAGCGPSAATSSLETTSSSASSSDDVCVSSSYTPAVDYLPQAKLSHDYVGKSFLTDGIGPVTLVQKIDGDTAHFKQTSGSTLTIKGRYNCIDTPESTGMVEPWGHGASEYNGSLLASAKTIVLSTDSHAEKTPAVDSTGSRYLVYVWISTSENAAYGDLTLVNLALCQQGWSKAKGATDTDYGDAFIHAAAQAQTAEVRVWAPASVKDCDYNYNASSTTTMKNIIDGVDNEGKAFDWVGAKATFTGIVAATGPDNGAAFLNQDFTWSENGQSVTRRYGIYVFTQYIVFAPLKTVGNELEVTGLIAEYEGVKQLVSVSYNEYYPADGDMKILSTGKTLTPLTGTAAELEQDQNINVVVQAPALTCTYGYATLNSATTTAYSFTLYCKDAAGTSLNVYIVDTILVPYAEDYTYTASDGKTTTYKKGARVSGDAGVSYFKDAASITLTGGLVTYTTTKGVKTYQVKLCKAADLVVTM
jgi:endonuclease YncB( thermonuclease family)